MDLVKVLTHVIAIERKVPLPHENFSVLRTKPIEFLPSRFSHGMDQSRMQYSLKALDEQISFHKSTLRSLNSIDDEHSSGDFGKCFTIDDDDIFLLDPSEAVVDVAKAVLDELICTILEQDQQSSQIASRTPKRSYECTDEANSLLNKKVRLNSADDDRHPRTYLFVSETMDILKPVTPTTQFLSHLGLDLCLEQSLTSQDTLSAIDRHALTQSNAVFHQHSTYSCKYCAFQTDSIHAMDYHYRTPHVQTQLHHRPNKYRCTYCSFQAFRIPELRRHLERKHGYSLVDQTPLRRYPCHFCTYETDDQNSLVKHQKRCQFEQERSRLANNLLAPPELYNNNKNNLNRNR